MVEVSTGKTQGSFFAVKKYPSLGTQVLMAFATNRLAVRNKYFQLSLLQRLFRVNTSLYCVHQKSVNYIFWGNPSC